MKLQLVALASIGLAVAHPSRHNHHAHHHVARAPTPADVVSVPGPTVITYELNGVVISAAEVEEGIKNGTLVWADGVPEVQSSSSSSYSSAAATKQNYYSASQTQASSSVYVATSSVASASSSSSAYVAASSSASSTGSATSSASSSSSSSSSSDSTPNTATGIDTTFPDDTIDCSDFPSSYGALAVDYLDLGGWIGIQTCETSGDAFTDIDTATSGSCTEGAYCSYACPAGYQKSQWPSTQGSTGQSVGGLLCKDGKLRLTNTDLSSKLCIPGTDAVTVLVQNELSENVAVCRTDYPGTESETVPVNVAAGESNNLTCPDESTYYKWEGDSTSAQYYVNPSGVSVSDACQWGSSANPWGNYAPLNIGVGYSSGSAWLSIFANSPTTDAELDFTVEITGDNLSGKCRYSNGEYCSGDDYGTCDSTTGCTVSISSGTATFVFSSSS